MSMKYHARWISRQRANAFRKSNALGEAILLDTYNGSIIVEPAGSRLGDGAVLAAQEANYELQPVWATGPLPRLQEARKRLGLEAVPRGQ